MAVELQQYKSEVKPDWCPGCGDFAVLTALTKALQVLQLPPWQVLIVSGIGCSSNLPGFLATYGFHGIHGRALPVATGAKLANPEITVIASGGDGDGYGIGAGHFVHTMRRNLDITYVVMNNEIYGLTTGQASPTSEREHKTKSTPQGVIENPINPLALAIAAGATFVARGFSGDMKTLTDITVRGIKHKGFSLLDVMSPCVTYNKINTYDWFRQRVYVAEKEGHNPKDLHAAFAKAMEWPNLDMKRDRIPTGVIYEAEGYPTYEDLEPAYGHGPPLKQKLGIDNPDEILKEFY
ncbi:MAG: 2-oxoacid ferredoxin oxidoreductase [Euryarchaeota archaeon]|nr:2-oxoacid ferredoxin oxidoreductase [Euryarchaeota archaeon]